MNSIYKEGLNRKQHLLFPPSIDDYVDEGNQVRAIDSYVEILDLTELGFIGKGSETSNRLDGQPAFHPALLLKIYIYGYLNKVRSSRKLETEIKRNIEMMWLTQGLTPGYKTIANFRKDHHESLKKVFKEFVLLCRNIELIEGKLVAIDGAFLRANASKNKLVMKSTTTKDLESIDSKIEAYLTSLAYSDKKDRQSDVTPPLTDNMDKLKSKKKKLEDDLAMLEKLDANQYCKSDPDANLMRKPAHNLLAYNIQIAVDSSYKFIVATDVSSKGSDLDQLHSMAIQAKEAVQNDDMTATADTGYYNPKEIKKCVDDNIEVVVPIADKQKAQKAKGKFGRDAFTYNQESDSYTCPNGKILTKAASTQKKNGNINFIYRGESAMCKACPLREQCLPETTARKSIYRWEHEAVTEAHIEKMDTQEAKEIIKQRGSIVEHPFGTIKQHLGWSHFLVRGKKKVAGENALIMFTYNFRRLLNLIGIALFQKLLIALKEGNIEAIREEIAQYITGLWLIWVYYHQNMIVFNFRRKNVLIFK